MPRGGTATSPDALLGAFIGHGCDAFTGVPCSMLAGIFRLLEQMPAAGDEACYVPAVREDSALALAAGWYLAGRSPVVCMQNSGLGHSLNVLTSLHRVYSLPVILLISWRGHAPDAVEHEFTGRRLTHLLDAAEVARRELRLDDIASSVADVVAAARDASGPAALITTERV